MFQVPFTAQLPVVSAVSLFLRGGQEDSGAQGHARRKWKIFLQNPLAIRTKNIILGESPQYHKLSTQYSN